MKRFKPLKMLPLLFLLSRCASVDEKKITSGPHVVSCIVDRSDGGYQCASIDRAPSFVAFKDADDLRCVSPSQLEQFLKACKKKEVVELNFCSQECVDNSFCASPNDWKRIGERCAQ
jgi:hypothetical protein